MVEGDAWDITNAGFIKFASFVDDSYKIYDLISFGIIGAIGGIMGAGFCYVNYRMGKFRKQYLKTDLRKFSETMFYVILTGTIMYFAPLLTQN